MIPNSRVGGWIRPRCTTDRRLINMHDLIKPLSSHNGTMASRNKTGTVQTASQGPIKNLIDQGRFTRARYACHRSKSRKREGHRNIFEIVLACTLHSNLALGITLPAGLRDNNRTLSTEILTGQRAFILFEFLKSSAVNDPSTIFTGPRPHVDDPVSSLDGLFVVFDNDQGISEVA